MNSVASLTPRQTEILDQLGRQGFVSITELAASLKVSDMTIRRDTRDLAQRGVVQIVHGGVRFPHGNVHSSDFVERANVESEGKYRIARACVGLLAARETVIIDAGSTSFEVANQLPTAFRGTLITHSAPVIQQAHRLTSARLLSLGGEFLLDSQAFVGPMTVENIKRLRAQTAVIGVAAVHADGLYIDRDLELPTKRALIAAADRVIVVATSSKINYPALVHLMDFSSVDTLVTDKPLPADVAKALADANVEVIVA